MKNLRLNEVVALVIGVWSIIRVVFDIYKVNKNNKDNSKPKMAHSYLDMIISLLLSVVAIGFVFFIAPVYVSGDSMEPNFHDKQWVIQNKNSKDYSVGDVIVFYAPKKDKYLIKRIVADKGDIVEVTFGSRKLKIRVLDVREIIRKNDASELYEVLPE